jgi:sec-independent protein translocase protein TatA
MGLGGISIWQLAIVLVIVVLIFGTKRLKSIGQDLGGAVKGFRRAMDHDEDKQRNETPKSLEGGDAPDAEFPEQKDKSRSA